MAFGGFGFACWDGSFVYIRCMLVKIQKIIPSSRFWVCYELLETPFGSSKTLLSAPCLGPMVTRGWPAVDLVAQPSPSNAKVEHPKLPLQIFHI